MFQFSVYICSIVTPLEDTHLLHVEVDEGEKSVNLQPVANKDQRQRKVTLQVRHHDDGTRTTPRSSPRSSPKVSPRHVVDPKMIDRYLNKQKKGTIDVYWLFDDGGM